MNPVTDKSKIGIIGGDLRQLYAASYLAELGYEAAVFGFDNCKEDFGLCTHCCDIYNSLNNSDVLILPAPVSSDGKSLYMPYSDKTVLLNDLFNNVSQNISVFGGRVDGAVLETAKYHNLKISDYFDREELKIANAYLTAESAVSIAMNENKCSLKDSNVLVMGFGRIGKSLCYLLKSMGVNVYASARKKSDFEWIRAYGYSPVDTSKVCDVVMSCNLIFNTIPGIVLGKDKLCCIPEDCLIIDLASKPGGVDFDAAKKCGLKVIWALALPGKKLPKSAGKVIAETVLNILDDRGLLK